MVSFNESELNATCSNHSNSKALLVDKKFFYYNNVCQTGNHSGISCGVSGVPTAQQSSFSYYDNVTNSVKSITCSYTSTSNYCTANGYKKSCATDEIEDGAPCEYDTTYKKCIKKEDWCKNNNYKNLCQTGYELSGDACPYDSSYKKNCTKKQSETDKCKAQGYIIQCSSGYFNNGPYCTGDNGVKLYTTACQR